MMERRAEIAEFPFFTRLSDEKNKGVAFLPHLFLFVGMKKQVKDSRYVLTRSQVRRIIDFETNFRNRVLLDLVYQTGIRRGEVSRLTVADLDFTARKIRIVGKGHKVRFVPLLPGLISILKIYLGNRAAGYVFPGRKPTNPLSIWHINEIFKRAGIRAGVKHPAPGRKFINPHLFRHIFAREIIGMGMELKDVSDLLGHQSVQITLDHYATKPFLLIQSDYEKRALLLDSRNNSESLN